MRITTMLIGFAMAFKDQNDLDSIINSLMGLKLAHADGKEEYPAVLLFHEERPLSAFGPKASETIANAIVEGDKAISDSLMVAAKKQAAEKQAAAVESNFPKPIMCTAHPKKPASGYYEQSNETPHNPEHDVFVCPGCAEKAVAEGKKVQGILKKLQEQVKNMPSPIAPGAKKISTLVQVMDPKTKKPVGVICKIQTIREGKLHLMASKGAISVVDPQKVLIVGEQIETGDGKPPLVTLYKEPIKPDLERWKKAEENLDKKRTQLETAVEEKLEKELEKEGEKPEGEIRISEEDANRDPATRDVADQMKKKIPLQRVDEHGAKPGDIVREILEVTGGSGYGPRCRVDKIAGPIVHTTHLEGGIKGTTEIFDAKKLALDMKVGEDLPSDPDTPASSDKASE